jgi:hypothetical protein
MLTVSLVMIPWGLDRHRDDPQRHSMNAIDERHDQDQSGSPRLVFELPELEQHDPLILLDDSYRHRQANDRHEQYEDGDHIDSDHGLAFSRCGR